MQETKICKTCSANYPNAFVNQVYSLRKAYRREPIMYILPTKHVIYYNVSYKQNWMRNRSQERDKEFMGSRIENSSVYINKKLDGITVR